jgi:hypothetical protein
MPKSLTMFALLTGLTGLFIAPSPAFAQVCNPALAAGFLYQCPPAPQGLFDNRGFRHSRGDDGFHDNHGFHGEAGSAYVRVNCRNSRPQTCVQSFAFFQDASALREGWETLPSLTTCTTKNTSLIRMPANDSRTPARAGRFP